MKKQSPWLFVFGLSLALGCAGNGQPTEPSIPDTHSNALEGTQWRVEDIDGRGIIDRSRVTMRFSDEKKISGHAGCNRYFGQFERTGNRISIGVSGNTRMACVPALMEQEERFLAALSTSVQVEFQRDSILLLLDETGRPRLRAIRDRESASLDSEAR